MYVEHPVFENPKDESLKLWRYLNIKRLESFLKTSSLYFCRADKLKIFDPFEGTYPKLEYEFIKNTQGEDVARNQHSIMCNDTFVNCWHLNKSESIAMWKLYTKDNEGIAIQTTVKNFKNSFVKAQEKIRAGLVQYIDYEKQVYYSNTNYIYSLGNAFIAFIHKRDVYGYEKEYRAIYYNPNAGRQEGFFIEVDLSQVMQEIIVAPYTSNQKYDAIKKIVSEHLNNGTKVKRSSIEMKPYF